MNILLRLQNKTTLVAVISGLLLIAQVVCQQFGIAFDIDWVNTVITAVLGILTVLGVIVDPTTPGVGDSDVANAKTDISQTAEEIIKAESQVQ